MNNFNKQFLVTVFIALNSLFDITCSSDVFDQNLYESVIDDELCQAQVDEFATNVNVAIQFVDASGKIPNGILEGNIYDLGSYFQCLNIHQATDNYIYEGKYCSMLVKVPITTWNFTVEQDSYQIRHVEEMRSTIIRNVGYYILGRNENVNLIRENSESVLSFEIGICIPKVCSTQQSMDFIQELITIEGAEFSERYCRLPNDKPYVAADYVALVIFSIIIVLAICSTTVDLRNHLNPNKDPKGVNPYLKSFSLYTNTKRLFTYNKIPGSIECLDGMRALSMLWVLLGHTFVIIIFRPLKNLLVYASFVQKFSSLYYISAPYSVDTFYFMSGLLLVYTVISNKSRGAFIRVLHLYILNRYLRTFAVLAAVVLLQASLFHHVADGPYWHNFIYTIENCRKNWWATLLHVQNYVFDIDDMCLVHSWYLAIDTQLYVFAPVVLVLLYESKVISTIASVSVVIISLVITTIYSFRLNVSAMLPYAYDDVRMADYFREFYANTLTRSSPFFIGMFFGYLIFLYKNKKKLNKVSATIVWFLSFVLTFLPFISSYFIIQPDYDNQLFDNLLNSFARAMWATGLGLLILCCVQGYGGPINWFLSLDMWKIPARLSYAIYLVHFPLQLIYTNSSTSAYYFTEGDAIYSFFGYTVIAVLAAIILTLFIDSPLMTLQKLLLQGPREKRISPSVKIEQSSTYNGHNYIKKEAADA